MITSEELLQTLFPLLSVTTSAAVRTSVQATILQDIKNANAKTKNHRLNRVVQGLLFGIVQKGIDASSGASLCLHRRRVSLLERRKRYGPFASPPTCGRNKFGPIARPSPSSLSPVPSSSTSPIFSVRFFLGDLHSAEDDAEESDSDDEGPMSTHSCTSAKSRRKPAVETRRCVPPLPSQEEEADQSRKRSRRQRQGHRQLCGTLPPQRSAKLWREALRQPQPRRSRKTSYDRNQDPPHAAAQSCVGAHKLCVLSFYSYVVKYLGLINSILRTFSSPWRRVYTIKLRPT